MQHFITAGAAGSLFWDGSGFSKDRAKAKMFATERAAKMAKAKIAKEHPNRAAALAIVGVLVAAPKPDTPAKTVAKPKAAAVGKAPRKKVA